MNEENKNGMSIFNGPLPTDEPQVEETTEELPVEETTDEEVKISGTATEEEIYVDATKPEDEVLDEEEIVKDVKEETEKSKRGLFFIFVILALVIVFIFFLPQILKATGVI